MTRQAHQPALPPEIIVIVLLFRQAILLVIYPKCVCYWLLPNQPILDQLTSMFCWFDKLVCLLKIVLCQFIGITGYGFVKHLLRCYVAYFQYSSCSSYKHMMVDFKIQVVLEGFSQIHGFKTQCSLLLHETPNYQVSRLGQVSCTLVKSLWTRQSLS